MYGNGYDPYGYAYGAGFPYRAGYGLILVDGPYAEPVDLQEFKTYIRSDPSDTDQDSEFLDLIASAREYVETAISQQIVAARWIATWDRFPYYEEQPLSYGWFRSIMRLPKPPLLGVNSIQYVDTDNNVDVIDPSLYIVDASRAAARITPAFGQIWPVPQWVLGAVQVQFAAGYVTPFTVNHSTAVFTALGNAYAAGAAVRATNSGGALPAGMAANTDYYVVNVSGNTFQLSLALNGSAITLTDNGTGTNFFGMVPNKVRRAIKLLAAHWERNREAVTSGQLSEVPLAVESLIGASWHGEYA